MVDAMLREGTTIDATSFADGKKFTVSVISAKPIADGGTAKIFLARSEVTDEQGLPSTSVVALKWFVNNMAEAQQQLLDRELRAVRHVRHQYILPYLGTAVFGFNKILIAPYMMNGSLLHYLKSRADLDRRPLLIQVATAVDFLHGDQNIIHGDLKCENVLVADDGSTRLADFGLSAVIERTDESTRTATALRQQLTIAFAAPELLFGTEPLASGESERPARRTTKTDVYAFGMLVIQAVTGRPPWCGLESTQIVVKLHSRVCHPRPEGGLSDLWWHSCIACWVYNPSNRPTMRDLLDRLNGRELQRRVANVRQERPKTVEMDFTVVYVGGAKTHITLRDARGASCSIQLLGDFVVFLRTMILDALRVLKIEITHIDAFLQHLQPANTLAHLTLYLQERNIPPDPDAERLADTGYPYPLMCLTRLSTRLPHLESIALELLPLDGSAPCARNALELFQEIKLCGRFSLPALHVRGFPERVVREIVAGTPFPWNHTVIFD